MVRAGSSFLDAASCSRRWWTEKSSRSSRACWVRRTRCWASWSAREAAWTDIWRGKTGRQACDGGGSQRRSNRPNRGREDTPCLQPTAACDPEAGWRGRWSSSSTRWAAPARGRRARRRGRQRSASASPTASRVAAAWAAGRASRRRHRRARRRRRQQQPWPRRGSPPTPWFPLASLGRRWWGLSLSAAHRRSVAAEQVEPRSGPSFSMPAVAVATVVMARARGASCPRACGCPQPREWEDLGSLAYPRTRFFAEVPPSALPSFNNVP